MDRKGAIKKEKGAEDGEVEQMWVEAEGNGQCMFKI